jgi:hypothetical protein
MILFTLKPKNRTDITPYKLMTGMQPSNFKGGHHNPMHDMIALS